MYRVLCVKLVYMRFQDLNVEYKHIETWIHNQKHSDALPSTGPTPWSPRMRGEIPSLVTISYTSSIDTSIIVSSKIVITNIASHKDNWKCHNFNWWYSRLGKALKWRVDLKLIQVITITKSYLKLLITISNFHSAYSWNCLTSSCFFIPQTLQVKLLSLSSRFRLLQVFHPRRKTKLWKELLV